MSDLLSGYLGIVMRFLLDNCSSLGDCWDNVIPAAAAAVGAGAAAVLAGGLLLNPENRAGPTGDDPSRASGTPPGPPQTPFMPPQSGGMPGAGPIGYSMPPPGGQATVPPPPISTPPSTPPPPAPPVGPLPDVIGAVGAAGGLGATVASSRQSSTGTTGRDEVDDDAEGDACPEADPTLFGLPDNNTRQDCSGARAGMEPTHTGIDFTSMDERGQVRPLPFEACVSGTVSFVGGPFNMVEVTLRNGSRVQFLHASRIYVRVGEKVGSTTRLGVTGGTGPQGPNQYEPHLHIQALDKEDNLIDPDCAIAGKEDRKLRVGRGKARKRRPTVPKAEQPSSARPQQPTMPLTPPGTALIMCGFCGMSNPPGAGFCGRCGKSLAQPPTPTAIACGRCGMFNPPGAGFCGRCGTRLPQR